MNSLLLRKPHPNPIGVIIRAVCDEFGIHQTRLLSKCRTAEVALARQTAMYIGRKLTSASTPELADAFNKRNHCTVIHACRVVSDRSHTEPDYRAKLLRLTAECQQEIAR